ncbi:glycosyltransferase family 2 protein [Herbiconiux sp. L3-i23]|uniref:glycosyltransferase family 2 protein n=1 Tax=Herbiconiux sp. L3-i23 TaxID=2905871 RepID=UPI00205F8AE4|nr:glycosyltransferase family 2 protein [Herbiconiux sp. L3-i23]BDI21614.1 hypothetical protein L3i23_03900 [Herbiconiux sp. L3-i23]
MDIAVVMPAHNEAEGIGEFLAEIEGSLAGRFEHLYIVVDDCSSDETADRARAAAAAGGFSVDVIPNPRNLGHGPSALRAYRAGLTTAASVVVHVDGDGQFRGEDVLAVVQALDGNDVVHGIRRGRTDAWYRRVLTGTLGAVIRNLAGGQVFDANTPLRAYRREALRSVCDEVPDDALVPHVHFSVLERRLGLRVVGVDVDSLPRRGSTSTGTMWGRARFQHLLPPARLVSFTSRAARELLTLNQKGRRAAVETLP